MHAHNHSPHSDISGYRKSIYW